MRYQLDQISKLDGRSPWGRGENARKIPKVEGAAKQRREMHRAGWDPSRGEPLGGLDAET